MLLTVILVIYFMWRRMSLGKLYMWGGVQGSHLTSHTVGEMSIGRAYSTHV